MKNIFTRKRKKDVNHVYEAVHALSILAKIAPDTVLIAEAPGQTVRIRLGDANIYEGYFGEVVVDAE